MATFPTISLQASRPWTWGWREPDDGTKAEELESCGKGDEEAENEVEDGDELISSCWVVHQ